MEPYNLEKGTWTDADFEIMGWHDSSIHSISFQSGEANWTGDLLLDIDYIFKWIHPAEGQEAFSFWIAPCTLIFRNAFDLSININTSQFGLDVQDILDLMLVSRTTDQNGTVTYKWTIELTTGTISLQSEGFTQIVRQRPIYTGSQQLTLDERGGISFGRSSFM